LRKDRVGSIAFLLGAAMLRKATQVTS
jgi:hypothetical protein